MKTIMIDGTEYNLVPIDKKLSEETLTEFTMSKEVTTDCGTFKFSVLLLENGDTWTNTESITFKKSENEEQFWDNDHLIKKWLEGDYSSTTRMEEDLTDKEIHLLRALRDKVSKLGWVK